MKQSKYISPDISPRILVNISSLYTEPQRVLMEFVDNSFDDAQFLYNINDNSYSRPLEFTVELNGANYKTARIIISDNCRGMDEKGLLRIIREIGNSDKKEQAWTNGQFGYGIYSFMAICSGIEIISKNENGPPMKIRLNRESLNVDHSSDVKLRRPTTCHYNEFRENSGTAVTLSAFDKNSWHDLDETTIISEIEKHFELLLSRKNLKVKIISSLGSDHICEPYDYSQYEGDAYEDTVFKLPAAPDKRRQVAKVFNLQEPLRINIKITKERDINKRPVIISKGRRIGEIKDLRSFKSKNKQTIWNHPNLTGYIDVGDLVSPTIARTDFRSDAKTKALFNYLLEIEGLVLDLIEKATKASVERHYQQLEDALNRALSRLARMDTIAMKYRTDIISGKGMKLEAGSSGRDLVNDWGAKDRGDGEGGKGKGLGEEEGNGVGVGDSPGRIPGGEEDGDSASFNEAENPYKDSNLEGKEIKRSGFNVRIVDRPPDKTKDERTSKIVEKRSILAGNTIDIFRTHEDFQKRVSESRVKEHRITQRLISYLAGEMTVHYKDMFHVRDKQPEYGKWMFVDLTESIYMLEDMLYPLVGKNMSDLAE